MPTRTLYDVYWMTEGDVLVRGTLDPMKALELAILHADEEDCGYGMDDRLAGAARPRPGIDDPEIDPAQVQHLATWCHDFLDLAKSGYYRRVPCLPSSYGYGEYSWMMHQCSGPARGAFPAVYFRG